MLLAIPVYYSVIFLKTKESLNKFNNGMHISKFSSNISINLFLRSVVIPLLVFTGCPGKELSSMILYQMSEQTRRQRTQFWQPCSHLSPSRATRQPVAPAWHLQLSHFKRMPSLRQSTPVAFLQVKASLSLGTMMAANRIANNIGRAIFWRAMSVFEVGMVDGWM